MTPWTVAYQSPLFVGFSRQEYLSGLPFPPPGDPPDLGTEPSFPETPASQAGSLSAEPPGKWARLTQSFLNLWNPMDCRRPGSSVHEILQARIPEWVAISLFRGSSQPRDGTHISCNSCIAGGLFTTEPLWKANI